jgi:hypothetical protein
MVKILCTSIFFIISISIFNIFIGHYNQPLLNDEKNEIDKNQTLENNQLKDQSFAVVELFTSEGCSSCPPAEDVFAGLRVKTPDLKIYRLAFHVDYWNSLGWKDPFSSKEYSERQYEYASALRTETYTPMMIVNGKLPFTGSDKKMALKRIKEEFEKQPLNSIELNAIPDKINKTVTVNYKITGVKGELVINIAAVERYADSRVTGGENSGKNLHHENIVRAFKTIVLDKNYGTITVSLPIDLSPENFNIIAYTQNPESKIITGAAELEIL